MGNSVHNTKTRRKELKIISWRVLRPFTKLAKKGVRQALGVRLYSSIITFVLAFWAYLTLMIEVVVIGELKVVLEQLVAFEAQVGV